MNVYNVWIIKCQTCASVIQHVSMSAKAAHTLLNCILKLYRSFYIQTIFIASIPVIDVTHSLLLNDPNV